LGRHRARGRGSATVTTRATVRGTAILGHGTVGRSPQPDTQAILADFELGEPGRPELGDEGWEQVIDGARDGRVVGGALQGSRSELGLGGSAVDDGGIGLERVGQG
jgi:hypothetical protein